MALAGLLDACSNSVAKIVFKGLQRYMKCWSTHVDTSFSISQVKRTDNGTVRNRKLGASELGEKARFNFII